MSSTPSQPPFTDPTPPAKAEPRIYRVGTLTYTRGALLQVMFWMLWGDFFFVLMEALTPGMIPLQLRWEGASDSLIGLLASSLSAVLGFFLYPIVGMHSDRHRGPLGRRRPFLIWCTPPVVISLILLGAAKPAGALLYRVLSSFGLEIHLTTAGCTITWIAICTVVFVIFNAYIGQVYQYLFADVIPHEVMGKFFGFYRAIGAIGSLSFNRWALGRAESHTLHIYGLIALLYAGVFYVLVWKVKEGKYPPPPPKAAGGGWGATKIYFKECFTNPFYLTYYSLSLFFWSSLVPLNFIVFFATKAGQPGYAPSLGLSLQEFGEVKGWTFLIQIPIYFLVGPFVDRFHPIRVAMVGLFLTSVSYFCCFLFIHNAASLLLWWCLNQGAIAIWLGCAALTPRMLPRDKYGQFFSANQTFGYISLIVTPPLVGFLLERIRDYRYVFAFSGVSTALTFITCVALYVQWKRLGGDLHFKPPETSIKDPSHGAKT